VTLSVSLLLSIAARWLVAGLLLWTTKRRFA
jgi:hypothetical protein